MANTPEIDKPALARRAMALVRRVVVTLYYRVHPTWLDPTPHAGAAGIVSNLDHCPVPPPSEEGGEFNFAEYVPAQVLCDSQDLEALGGRDCFFARRAMERLAPNARWKIVSLPLGEGRYRPGDDWTTSSACVGHDVLQAEGVWSLDLLDQWVEAGRVVAASRDGSCLKVLLAHAPGRKFRPWQDLAEAGLVELVGGEKSNKRASQLYRDFRYASSFKPGEVKLRVSEKPEGMDPETWKKVGDGMGVMSHALWELLKLRALKRAQYMADPDAKSRAIRAWTKDQNTRSLNARALGLCPGLLKLQLYVAPPEAGDGLWIETHPENVKKELSAHKDLGEVWLAADPQAPHAGAKLCGQSLQSFSWFYHEARVKRYIDADVGDLSDPVLYDRLNEELDRVDTTRELILDGRVEDGVGARDRMMAAEMLDKGVSPLINSALTTRLLNYSFDGVVSREDANIRVNIPGSWFGPVVSAYAARLVLGRPVDVHRGGVVYDPWLQAFVVHDEDWVKLIRECGGCDLDDKFTLVFRWDAEMNLRVLIHRSPNAKGEFFTATFEGLPEDLPPGVTVPEDDAWEWTDPKVDSRPASVLAQAGERPLAFPPLAKKPARAWTYAEVRADVREYLLLSAETAGLDKSKVDNDPGSLIKWSRLYTVLTGKVCKLAPGMEDAVDRLVQYGDLAARLFSYGRRKAIKEYVSEALEAGRNLDMVEAARCRLKTSHKGLMTRVVEYAEAKVAEAKRAVEGFCDRQKDLADKPDWARVLHDKCPAKALRKRVEARDLAIYYQNAYRGLQVSPFFDDDEKKWTQLGWVAMDLRAQDLLATLIAGLQSEKDPTGWLNFAARLAWAANDQDCRKHRDLARRHDDRALLRPLVFGHYVEAASRLLDLSRNRDRAQADMIAAEVQALARSVLSAVPEDEVTCELRLAIRHLIAD